MIVTHNLQQAHRVADHVAFMYLGELVEYGPAEQVFDAPQAQRTRDYVRRGLRVSAAAAPLAVRCVLAAALALAAGCRDHARRRAPGSPPKRAGKRSRQKGLDDRAGQRRRQGRGTTGSSQDANGVAAVVRLKNTRHATRRRCRSRSRSRRQGQDAVRQRHARPGPVAASLPCSRAGAGGRLGQRPGPDRRQGGRGEARSAPAKARRPARCRRSADRASTLGRDARRHLRQGQRRNASRGRAEAPRHLRASRAGAASRRRRPRDRRPARPPPGRRAAAASPSSSSATRSRAEARPAPRPRPSCQEGTP